VNDPQELDRLNAQLLEDLNNTGSLFLTHTRLNGVFTLRLVIGQTEVRDEHVRNAWLIIQNLART
jgi:aromatic-L-amino-acid decarboxylase